MKKDTHSGHFCWCCERVLANEGFSGSGHSRHVCKECAQLGPSELLYRQELLHLRKLAAWDGFIRRKQRAALSRFLQHPDPRIRQAAEDLDRASRNIEFKGDESAPLVPSDSMAFSDTTSDTRAEIDDDDVPF